MRGLHPSILGSEFRFTDSVARSGRDAGKGWTILNLGWDVGSGFRSVVGSTPSILTLLTNVCHVSNYLSPLRKIRSSQVTSVRHSLPIGHIESYVVPSTRFLSQVATIRAKCGIRRTLSAGSENGAKMSAV